MGKKVFLGGLSWSSTPESLCSFFTALEFEVEKAVIMCDKQTGKSRGFGFIVFADSCTKELQSHYEVEGRLVEVKTALRKHEIIAPVKQHTKIFVGGIPQEVTWDELLSYFSQFGEVIGGQIMIDKKTKRSRGFGFVKFLHEESISLAFSIEHYIHFKKIEIKIAESNPKKLQKNSFENSFENSESANSFEADGSSDSIYERIWVNPNSNVAASKKFVSGQSGRQMTTPPRDESGSTTASSRSSVRSLSSSGHETAISRSQASVSESENGQSDDESADDSKEESEEEVLRFNKGYGPNGHKSNFKIQTAQMVNKSSSPHYSPNPTNRVPSVKSPQPNMNPHINSNKGNTNINSPKVNPVGNFINPVFNAQLYGHNYPQNYNQPLQNFPQTPYGQNYNNPSNLNFNPPRNPNLNPNYNPYQNPNFNPNFTLNFNPNFNSAKANRAPVRSPSHISNSDNPNHDLDFMLFMQDYKIEATAREIILNSELSQSHSPDHFHSSESTQSQPKEVHHKDRSSTSNPKSLRKFLSTSTSKIAFKSSNTSSGGEESPPRNFIVLLFSSFSDKKTVVSVKREHYSMAIREFVEHAASKEGLSLQNSWTIMGIYGPTVQDNLGLKLVVKPADQPLIKPLSSLASSTGMPFKERGSSHESDSVSADHFASQHHSLFGTSSLLSQLNWNSESFTPTEQEKLKIGNPVFNTHKQRS